jgi:NAD(P)-dependent dehydrogenase (short-subunit alcohol dehydrogenase family)
MKTIIITGANSGLGFECAKNILLAGSEYYILMACRNPEKAEQAKMALIDETGNKNVQVMELDLTSLLSVRSFIANYKNAQYPPLFGLVCNAGIAGNHIGLTAEGHELIFGTNHLGHFLLTNLLLPSIMDRGRIVIVSSDMHNPPGGLTYPGAKTLANPGNQLGNKYPLSKLCNLYFTYELSKRLSQMGKQITVNAFNPGLLTDTNLNGGNRERYIESFLARVADRVGSLPVSSKALADMITQPYYGEISGRYNDRGNDVPSSELSYNLENAIELWETSVGLSGLQSEDTLSELLL